MTKKKKTKKRFFKFKDSVPEKTSDVPLYSFKKVVNGFLAVIIVISITFNVLFFFMVASPDVKLGLNGAVDTILAMNYNPTGRSLATNLTKGCHDDQRCYFFEIRKYIADEFDYVSDGNGGGRLYPLEQTLNDKSGDCENLAFTMASLFSEVGGSIVVQCNICHCWNVIKFEDGLFIYDATSDKFTKYSKTIVEQYDKWCIE